MVLRLVISGVEKRSQKRAKRRGVLRNVAVAVPALVRALEDEEPLVRGHAAWALGRIASRLGSPCGAPEPIKPASDLYGELLLDAGDSRRPGQFWRSHCSGRRTGYRRCKRCGARSRPGRRGPATWGWPSRSLIPRLPSGRLAPMHTANAATSTAEQIVELACELAQTRGYNAFSYRDLALQIGIRAASIHHHFPSKADLCRAMIQRHREQLADSLERIGHSGKRPSERLRAYFELSRQTVRSDCGVCLGGMLAAELLTLAPEAQTELKGFFTDGEEWLRGVLEEGVAAGELSVNGSPRDAAVAIVSALQGAMMVARAHADPASFYRTIRWLLEFLTGA